jgi:hypothetical protein
VGNYRSISQCTIGDGTSVLFWKDFWHGKETLNGKFPRLFSYARDEDITVAKFASTDISSCFALPPSVEAFQEYQLIMETVSGMQIQSDVIDRRTFVWGNKYTPSQFYNFLFEQLSKDDTLNAIWKSEALPKLKVFLWLLIVNNLTQEISCRENIGS